MSAQTAVATQPVEVPKHPKPFKHVPPKNAFDQIQKALEQAEEKEVMRAKSIPWRVQQFK